MIKDQLQILMPAQGGSKTLLLLIRKEHWQMSLLFVIWEQHRTKYNFHLFGEHKIEWEKLIHPFILLGVLYLPARGTTWQIF